MTDVPHRGYATLRRVMKEKRSAVAGFILIIVAWEIVGRGELGGRSLPAPTMIAPILQDEARRALLWRASVATIRSSSIGLTIAALIGSSLAIFSVLAKPAAAALERVATGVQAMPSIAFAPILIITAGAFVTPIAIAVLGAFFPVYVALRAGFNTVPRAYIDLAEAMGASRFSAFLRLELPHVVPDFLDGLRLGAPAALLGAIIGEWFGAPRGLGLIIITSMQNYMIPQLWAAALISVALSLFVYGMLSVGHRWTSQRFFL